MREISAKNGFLNNKKRTWTFNNTPTQPAIRLLTLFLSLVRRGFIFEDGKPEISDFGDLILLGEQDIPRG